MCHRLKKQCKLCDVIKQSQSNDVCSLVCPINLLAETIDGRIPCVCLWWELICQRCHPLEQRYNITAVKIDSSVAILQVILQISDLERWPVFSLAKRQIRWRGPLASTSAPPRGWTGDAWLNCGRASWRRRPRNAAMIHEATDHWGGCLGFFSFYETSS